METTPPEKPCRDDGTDEKTTTETSAEATEETPKLRTIIVQTDAGIATRYIQ